MHLTRSAPAARPLPILQRRSTVVALLVAVSLGLALAVLLGVSLAVRHLPGAGAQRAAPPGTAEASGSDAEEMLRGLFGTEPTERDGVLPDGASPFDTQYPGVSGLDPALLSAVQAAASAAAVDGVEFAVTSGWRSASYQQQLLRDAVEQYGSESEAARWVATAETSAHVSGDAVDIGDLDATLWLSQYGAQYGLCQTYANESWHFELRPDAAAVGCPDAYLDPTFDSRLTGG
ncbi:M15 family metallopeptidase [Leucobacter chromiiresistens]